MSGVGGVGKNPIESFFKSVADLSPLKQKQEVSQAKELSHGVDSFVRADAAKVRLLSQPVGTRVGSNESVSSLYRAMQSLNANRNIEAA